MITWFWRYSFGNSLNQLEISEHIDPLKTE